MCLMCLAPTTDYVEGDRGTVPPVLPAARPSGRSRSWCSWGRANARLRTVAMSSQQDNSEPAVSSVRVDGRVLDLLHVSHANIWEEPQRHSLSETIRELMQRERERQNGGEQ
jgi:hypothetical protein